VPGARAVALVINSPGGSPSQSHLIFRRIRDLAEEKKLAVYAFVEDVGASGGYMLACAADQIVCDPYSIVGSIGVVGGSFGFVELMHKLGIERRVYTAGERKVMLDRYVPKVRLPLIETERSFLGRRLAGVGGALAGPGLADDLMSAAEARALWSRYGL
jgi:ClpP class serine protease